MLNSSNGWAQGDSGPCSAMNIKITIEKTADCRRHAQGASQTEILGRRIRFEMIICGVGDAGVSPLY